MSVRSRSIAAVRSSARIHALRGDRLFWSLRTAIVAGTVRTAERIL